MTDATDYSTPAQVRRIAEDFRRRRTRMLVAFACVEAPVLVGAIVVVYVLKLVDPQFGMWLVRCGGDQRDGAERSDPRSDQG